MTFFHMVWFSFQRRSERARIRAIILGRGASLVVACTLFLAAGCNSWSTRPTFERTIQDLQWSILTLADMRDAEQSLRDDLAAFSNPEPGALKETITMWGW